MTDKEVMQMALDALYENTTYSMQGDPVAYQDQRNDDTIEALRAALAQPEQEPVAYLTKRKVGGTEGLLRADFVDMSERNQETHHFIPLYKNPTPCQTCESLARSVMLDQTSHDTKKEWVGLTEEDIAKNIYVEGEFMLPYSFASSIQVMLKDKNGF